jgi:DNA-binding SARP family transcriptional activator
MFERMPAGSVLVLDNFHEAECHDISQLLAHALDELPEARNVMVISRAEPPAELTRLFARNSMTTLEWRDLRLTPHESAAIAASNGITDSRTVDFLHQQSDGWMAGLVLMLATSRRRLGSMVAQDFHSKESIFQYFAGEIFDRATIDDQETLIQTALFPEFTEDMAVAITGSASAPQLLDQLFRKQYFTERRGAQKFIYRYHDLFRQFLEEKAADNLGDEKLRILRGRAGRILLQEGALDAAVVQFRAAGDADAIADIVELHGERMLSQGRWQPLITWCIATANNGRRPWITFWHGLAVGAIDAHGSQQILPLAYDRFVEEADHTGQILACSAMMDSYFHNWDTVAELDLWIDRMEVLLSNETEMPSQIRARALSSMVVSLLHRQPCHPLLSSYAEETYSRIPSTVDANQKYLMASSLVYYYDLRGSFSRGSELVAMTRHLIDSPELSPVIALSWCYRCGLHYVYSGNVEGATELIYRGLNLARNYGTGWVGYVSAFMAEVAEGRIDAAALLLSESRGFLDSKNRMHLIAVYWLELWLLVMKRKMSEAAMLWVEFSRVPIAGVPIHTVFNHPVICVLVHIGKHVEALEKVKAYRELLKGMNSPVIEFNILCMEAYIHLKAGERDNGLLCLASMIRIGKVADIYITLCWVPEMMAYLCDIALDQGIEVDYVRRIIRDRRLTAPNRWSVRWPRPLKIFTLGRFEIQRDDEPVEYSRKAPRKLVALLKAVIACGDRGAAAQQITDALWGDLESDAAHEALATNLHRLRKLLGRPDAIRLVDGRISFNFEYCWIDVLAFEELIELSERAGKPDRMSDAVPYAERAAEIYKGVFLPHDQDQPWSFTARERLRGRFTTLVSRMGAHYENSGESDLAIGWYRRGIEADNLAEAFYQGLIRCLAKQGRRAESAAIYRQLKQTLSIVLGVAPSPATQVLGETVLGSD